MFLWFYVVKETSNGNTKKYLDELTYELIGDAIQVHKKPGPGLIESVYEKCFFERVGDERNWI